MAVGPKNPRYYSPYPNIEIQYHRALMGIAKECNRIAGNAPSFTRAMAILTRYAEILEPYAEKLATNMVLKIERKDRQSWSKHSKKIAQILKNSQNINNAIQFNIINNINLIKSIPLDAAEKAMRLAGESATGYAGRAEEIAEQIASIGRVSYNKAKVIARTEVSRVGTSILESRAKFIGSKGYIWRSAEDESVRPSHRAMNNKYVDWNNPPHLDGMTGHAGQFPNCRCIAEPVIPTELL